MTDTRLHNDCDGGACVACAEDEGRRREVVSLPNIKNRCGDPACNEGREDKMVVVQRDRAGTPTVWCDPCIVDIVAALNASGIKTIASCCGHGRIAGNIILADGRHLLLSDGPPEWDGGKDINGDLE